MVDKFLKIAGVNNMEDFYKLHPTEEHFFKTYPHAKKEIKKKRIRKAAKGGMLTQYADGTPSVVPANLLPYFEEQMKRQGKVVLTDKGTNTTYYGTKKPDGSWDVNSFEVLTGRNPNINAVQEYGVDQLENLPNNRATPIGIFPLKYDKDIYGMPGYTLTGSIGGEAGKSNVMAYHLTYKAQDDPNRGALYANDNNQDNYRSFGCINCQKPSMEHLLQFVGNDPHVSTYVVNSNLSEQENRDWFNKNTPKYIYHAETGQTKQVIPAAKKAAPQPTITGQRAAVIQAYDPGAVNAYQPWYHSDARVARTNVAHPVTTPMMMLPHNNQQAPAQQIHNDQVLKKAATRVAGDPKVAEYQQFLNQQMPGVNLATDGMWGPKTQAAYEAYMAKQKGTPLIEHNEYAYGGNTMYATKGSVDPDVAMRNAAEKTINNTSIPFTFPDGKTKKWSSMTENERQYVQGLAMKNAGRINTSENAWYDNFNPVNGVMSMAGSLYTAPYEAEKSGSYMPWAKAIAEPILTAVGLSTKTLKTVDNIATASGKKLAQRVGQGKNVARAAEAEESTPVEIIYPKKTPKVGPTGPTRIDITPGGNIVPRTSAIRPSNMTNAVGEYVPYATTAESIPLPPGPSQPLLLGEGLAQEVGPSVVDRVQQASKLGAFDYLPTVISDASALVTLSQAIGTQEAKKIPVEQRKKIVEQIKKHNEEHPPVKSTNPQVTQDRVLEEHAIPGHWEAPNHFRGDVELQGEKQYFKNSQDQKAYEDKYLNSQTMKKTQKKYGGRAIRRRNDMATFAEGGPAPGQYRLFDLPGGFHYDISEENAKYLPGTLFDPSHSGSYHASHPAVHPAAHPAVHAAAHAAMPVATRPAYDYRAAAHQLNEQELAQQYAAQTAARRGQNSENFWKNEVYAKQMDHQKPTEPDRDVMLRKFQQDKEHANVAGFQQMLNEAMGTNLAVDGQWGPKTQAAYEAYMRKKNMTGMIQEPTTAAHDYLQSHIPTDDTHTPIHMSMPTYGTPAVAPAPAMNIAPRSVRNQFKGDNPMGKNQMNYGGYYAEGGKLPEEVLRARLESHMSPSEADEYLSTYAKGGGIHIDPSKKGTFKAQATRMGMSVQQAASHILANKEHYSPAMVKKANFARNFAKAYGGYTYQEGGETMPQEQMEGAPQQAQEQAMGQEQQPQGGDQMMQQIMQMVAQALQQGVPPEQIVQMLVQQGVPQEMALQAVQMVMQQMGGGAPQGGPGQQYQPQGGQYQGPQSMQPQAAYGGYYANGGFFNEGYLPFDY